MKRTVVVIEAFTYEGNVAHSSDRIEIEVPSQGYLSPKACMTAADKAVTESRRRWKEATNKPPSA